MSKTDRIQELCRLINKANGLYFNEGNRGGVSDALYDQWKDELANLVPANHPLLASVGAPISKDSLLKKGKHTAFMGSQFKASDVEDLEKWYKKVGEPVVYVTYKVDGASLCSYYKDSRINQAISRGDGFIGEDITFNIIKFVNFPISVNIPNFNGAVRGEGILFTKDWEKQEPEKLTNARNVGSGNIQRSDGKGCEDEVFGI